MQTVAGVMTGLVIRYADQVVKNLAAPSAVVITLFVARWLFGDPINVRNLLGVTLIASCTLTYGLSRSRQAAAEAEKAAGEKKKD